VSNNLHENNEDDLLNVIKVKYKNAYKFIEKLDEFIHKKYNYDLTDEEKLYLTIHVERVVSKSIKSDINPNN
ncbi:PRD domain-containing protein, partial [Clostridioides difficile]